jgi:hypothetical protein
MRFFVVMDSVALRTVVLDLVTRELAKLTSFLHVV